MNEEEEKKKEKEKEQKKENFNIKEYIDELIELQKQRCNVCRKKTFLGLISCKKCDFEVCIYCSKMDQYYIHYCSEYCKNETSFPTSS